MALKKSMTFGEYLLAVLTFTFSFLKMLSWFGRRKIRDNKHISALTIDPTKHKHIKIRNSHVSGPNLPIIFPKSSGLSKIEVVRKVRKAPSSVRIICALESALLYQLMTMSRSR